MEKYLFTFTARFDGSSKFGKNNKWGYLLFLPNFVEPSARMVAVSRYLSLSE